MKLVLRLTISITPTIFKDNVFKNESVSGDKSTNHGDPMNISERYGARTGPGGCSSSDKAGHEPCGATCALCHRRGVGRHPELAGF